jgi:hypothetical protein
MDFGKRQRRRELDANVSQIPLSTAVPDSLVAGGHLVAFDDLGQRQLRRYTPPVMASAFIIDRRRHQLAFLNSARMPILPGTIQVDKTGMVWVVESKSVDIYVCIGDLLTHKAGVWRKALVTFRLQDKLSVLAYDQRTIAIEPTLPTGDRVFQKKTIIWFNSRPTRV